MDVKHFYYLTREEIRKTEAFAMWCYRRLEMISWTERITNKMKFLKGYLKGNQCGKVYRIGEMN